MAGHPDPTRATGGSSTDGTTTDEILAVITAEEPHGATADVVARAVGLGLNGEVIQSLLEEMVACSTGVGSAMAPSTRSPRQHNAAATAYRRRR